MKITLFFVLVLAILFVGTPLVTGFVSEENANYRIVCTPETATLRPVGVGFEQYCWFTNKMESEVTLDFAMLFDTTLKTGRVYSYETYPFEVTYYCPTEDYGIYNVTAVYCGFVNGTTIVDTGTTRSFDTSGVGAVVYYEVLQNRWVDRTNLFDYQQLANGRNAYFVEDVTWSPGETKIVKFAYVPASAGITKWDAVFGDFSTNSVSLLLDPLSNPYEYESDFSTDNSTGTTARIIADEFVSCGSLDISPEAYYSMDTNANDDANSNDLTAIGASQTAVDFKRGGGSYSFDGTGDLLNSTIAMLDDSDDFTLYGWFNMAGESPTGIYEIMSQRQSVATLDWQLYRYPYNHPTLPNRITLDMGESFGTSLNWNGLPPLENVWTFLAIVKDGDDYTLYINATNKTRYNGITQTWVASDGFRIGSSGGSASYTGYMDEVGVVKRALSSAEIVGLYAQGSGQSYPYSNVNNCSFASGDFEINWNRASYSYTKNSQPANFSLDCETTQSVVELGTATSGSGILDCSDGVSLVNMSYSFNMGDDAEFYSLDMFSTSQGNLNITFKDSNTKNVIDYETVSLEIIGDYLSRNYSTTDGNIYISNLDLNNYTLRYRSNESYQEKFGYINLASSQNLTLYLTNSSTASNVTVSVIDQTGQEIENALVKSLRYDLSSNSYIVDEQSKTNYEGEAVFHIVLNEEFYKFVVEYPIGTQVLETGASYITNTAIVIRISTVPGFAESYNNAKNIVSALSFVDASDNFRLYYNSNNDGFENACLDVYKVDAGLGDVLVNSSCLSSATSTILLGVTPTNGTTYKSVANFYLDDETYSAGQVWHSYPDNSPFGNSGILLAFVLLIFAAMVGYLNIYFGTMFFVLTITGTKILGLLNWGWEYIIGLWLVAFVLVYLFTKTGGTTNEA